ncbi:MAG: type II CAAX prenyl endopeptidase Rce1 family protein [Pikeienuella sp.]|uniref:CPBP family glutamic-type intramembrane protease n=1 Tax=Pikeienuella sp. TaxID=2831957 RepID=UPI00391CC03C
MADASALLSRGGRRARGAHTLLAEGVAVFLLMPGLVFFLAGAAAAPFLLSAILWTSVILLSMSRNFLWADLLPRDALSEWPLFAGLTASFAAAALALGLVLAPGSLFSPEPEMALRLLLYPVLVALPLELFCRALFFRRYGRLFASERGAILFSAAAGAALWAAMGCGCGFAAFGAATGAALSWAYLRTGQFALSVALNWATALAFFLIAPGLAEF